MRIWTLAAAALVAFPASALAGSDWGLAKQDIEQRAPLHGRPDNRLDMERPASRAEAGAMALRQGDQAKQFAKAYVDGRLTAIAGVSSRSPASAGSVAGGDIPYFWILVILGVLFLAFLAFLVARGPLHHVVEGRHRRRGRDDDPIVLLGREVSEHNHRLEDYHGRLAGLRADVDSHGQRLQTLESAVGHHTAQLQTQGRALDGLQKGLAGTKSRVDQIHTRQDQADKKLAEAADNLAGLADEIERLLSPEPKATAA